MHKHGACYHLFTCKTTAAKVNVHSNSVCTLTSPVCKLQPYEWNLSIHVVCECECEKEREIICVEFAAVVLLVIAGSSALNFVFISLPCSSNPIVGETWFVWCQLDISCPVGRNQLLVSTSPQKFSNKLEKPPKPPVSSFWYLHI